MDEDMEHEFGSKDAIESKNGEVIKDLKCSKCDMVFLRMRNFERHMKRCGFFFECDKCDYKSKCRQAVLNHKETHTRVKKKAPPRGRKCKHCKEKFFSEEDNVNHIKAVHCPQDNMFCKQCGMYYRLKVKLLFHMRSAHGQNHND